MVNVGFATIEPGLQTTLQDWPGRVGHWRVGIPPSGPMDALSFRLANLLVGNAPGETALEYQFLGPRLECRRDANVAFFGGEGRPLIDGDPVPMGQTLCVSRGQVLDCGPVLRGARAYLAVAGGFDKELVLGSAATFPRGGLGGGALAAGDTLRFKAPAANRPRLRSDPAIKPGELGDPVVIEVAAGPHCDWLSGEGRDALVGLPWTVSPRSDRTGVRLEGPKIRFSKRALDKAPEHGTDPTNVINTGYPIGGVNVCGDTPIILPFDGPSQGGFITPFVVISAAMWKVGQLRPHQKIVLRRVTLNDAIALRRELDRSASEVSLLAAE